MTEKRFKISFDNNQNIYDKEEKCYYSSIDAEKLCDLLNDLEQEARDNEHYHSEVLQLYKAVSEENEQLKIKLIYNFIKNNIIPKYDVLCSCKVQDNEFYIEYDEFLSFDERNILNREILQQIYDFCVSSDIEEDCFFNISVFLVIKK
jgi:hypothetical protein